MSCPEAADEGVRREFSPKLAPANPRHTLTNGAAMRCGHARTESLGGLEGADVGRHATSPLRGPSTLPPISIETAALS
jgi:hypothetical protein